MKKFLLLACSVMTLPFALSAQSLASEEALGFEPFKGEPRWAITEQNAPFVSLTDEKAAEGSYSLKFDCADYGSNKGIGAATDYKKTHQGTITLQPGEYTVTAQVFLAGATPKKMTVNVGTAKSGQAKGDFVFDGLEKGKWVPVSTTISAGKTIENQKVSLSISSNPKFGGPVKMYIDAIKINKK